MKWLTKLFKLFPLRNSVKNCGIDRRRYPRVKTSNLLKIAPETVPNSSLTNLINISEGGIQFTYPKRIFPQTQCRMVLNFAEKDMQIPVTGRVVWVKKNKTTGHAFRAGVEFTDVEARDLLMIRNYVQETMALLGIGEGPSLQATG